MRILFLSEIFPPTHGGSGRWLWEVATRLDPSTVTVITHQHPNAEQFDRTHNLDICRIPLQTPEWGVRSRKGLRFYWQTLRFVRRTIQEKRSPRDTMIHCARCIPEGFVGYLMYRLYRTPYLCYVHGEDIETAKKSRELAWIVKRSLKGAQVLICNSQNTATLLKQNWSAPEHKIRVIHPGVNTDYFMPAAYCPQTRERLGWGKRPVLLTVGRLQKRKGHDNVIKALPLILRKHPDLLYCIVGQGEELSHLQTLVALHKVTESVQFISTARDEDLLAAYQQCNLFILANRTVNNDIEGFGMVLAEAQACGKTVIAGDSGGTREAMIPGETGWIVDCTDPAKIADAVNTHLPRDPIDTARQRAFVVDTLDWKVHLKKIITLMDTTQKKSAIE